MESQQVVGRFIDIEIVDAAASHKEQRQIMKWVPALESKVAGSFDVAHQRVKPFNDKALQSRFPGAWEHYEKEKAKAEANPVEDEAPSIPGTPIDRLDFIPREKLVWLQMQGFSVVEQIATLSDAQMQTLGTGARNWKKKASQFLSGQTSSVSRA
jgi:hypothetical protein